VKIKYKLIIIFIVITLMALLPVSYILTKRLETEKINGLARQGEIVSRFLAHSIMNAILANGADLRASTIDAAEAFSSLKSLSDDGLVYAEAALVSSKKGYHGKVLAKFELANDPLISNSMRNTFEDDLAHIGESRWSFRDVQYPGRDEGYYSFAATGALSGKPPMCMVRILYSKKLVFMPINEMRRITYTIVMCAVVLVSLLGYIFSRLISTPIVRLTETAARIESGDMDSSVPVTSRDEIGRLSITFNHMLHLIKQKIGELEESNKRLVELDVLKDEFLANTSHELKTPLFGIVGLAESLIHGVSGPLNADVLHNIRMIVASGKTLGNLVNDILDFSKMRHYDIMLNMRRVDMHDVAQLVVSITRPLMGNKSLTLENRIEPERAVVIGDDGRLQQILMNLVSNSVKFTEKGYVRLSSKRLPDNQIVITVEDTGIGIPPGKENLVFEMFQQGDGSITRQYGGTGLGLAITKKLVELHGGKIWYESKPGEGAAFSFTLNGFDKNTVQLQSPEEHTREPVFNAIPVTTPSMRMKRMKNALTAKADGETKGRAKILIVDDEPVNLLIVINNLASEGYDVITAENGEQVDEILSTGEIPDCILLDVMLPRISGFDICRKIRKKYSSHALPIIMLTARNTTRDIVAGIKAGANDYLVKPVSGEELIARVGNLVSMKNSVKLQSELKIIRNELELATELQKSILPSSIPSMKGFDIATRFIPSSHVSGDFYDYHLKDETNIGIIVADVAGHGIPAAMVSSMMQMAYSSMKNRYTEPSDILLNINGILCAYPEGVYLTACCVHLNSVSGTMRYSNAGHPPILIHRRPEKKMLSYSVNGRPIGIFDDSMYSTMEIDLIPGDRIILYTDGILEALNPDHVEFGTERFHSLIESSAELSVSNFVDRVIATVGSWSMIDLGRGLSDDVTLVVIDFNQSNKT
jgi:two-component system sensor histidine kinase ChiS